MAARLIRPSCCRARIPIPTSLNTQKPSPWSANAWSVPPARFIATPCMPADTAACVVGATRREISLRGDLSACLGDQGGRPIHVIEAHKLVRRMHVSIGNRNEAHCHPFARDMNRIRVGGRFTANRVDGEGDLIAFGSGAKQLVNDR